MSAQKWRLYLRGGTDRIRERRCALDAQCRLLSWPASQSVCAAQAEGGCKEDMEPPRAARVLLRLWVGGLGNTQNFWSCMVVLLRYQVQYIHPCGVVILHIGVGLRNVQDHTPREGYNYYITCYLGNITVQERYGQRNVLRCCLGNVWSYTDKDCELDLYDKYRRIALLGYCWNFRYGFVV